jgi:hypothetical protein
VCSQSNRFLEGVPLTGILERLSFMNTDELTSWNQHCRDEVYGNGAGNWQLCDNKNLCYHFCSAKHAPQYKPIAWSVTFYSFARMPRSEQPARLPRKWDPLHSQHACRTRTFRSNDTYNVNDWNSRCFSCMNFTKWTVWQVDPLYPSTVEAHFCLVISLAYKLFAIQAYLIADM